MITSYGGDKTPQGQESVVSGDSGGWERDRRLLCCGRDEKEWEEEE